jgi:predicted nucleotidyltransferase
MEVLLVQRLYPLEAAKHFISHHFPTCQGAVLAGSVVRGEATDTSDLDIVVFDNNVSSAYRESFFDFEWAIEVFVHNLNSYKVFFQSDYERARPSLPRMVSEGIVINDTGIIDSIKREANELLDKGPEERKQETITTKRYFLTDALDDFVGSLDRNEEIIIANTLAEAVHEFVLKTNGHWIGASK